MDKIKVRFHFNDEHDIPGVNNAPGILCFSKDLRFYPQIVTSSNISFTTAAGSWPGAEAFPAVAKVRQEPNNSPLMRLMAPRRPMDIVMTGVFGCSSFMVSVASRRVRTSRSRVGITAYLTMSAPSSCILQRSRTMSSFGGVALKA